MTLNSADALCFYDPLAPEGLSTQRAVAAYMGDVKVWPSTPTLPYWEGSTEVLLLVVPQDAVPVNNAVITVDVPAYTGGPYTQGNIFGLTTTSGVAQLTLEVDGTRYTCNIQDSAWSRVTNQEAIASFVGHTLKITFGFNHNIKTLEIMGVYSTAVLTQAPNGFVELAIPRSLWTLSGTVTVEVPALPDTLVHPEWRLGTAGTGTSPQLMMFPGTGVPQNDNLFFSVDAYPRVITNQIVQDEFAGHVVAFTLNDHQVTHVEVLE
jgi:hypothetical protein